MFAYVSFLTLGHLLDVPAFFLLPTSYFGRKVLPFFSFHRAAKLSTCRCGCCDTSVIHEFCAPHQSFTAWRPPVSLELKQKAWAIESGCLCPYWLENPIHQSIQFERSRIMHGIKQTELKSSFSFFGGKMRVPSCVSERRLKI